MPVNTKHPSFVEREADWNQISDCIAGQRVVKSRNKLYLPKPNSSDKSPDNAERYAAYLARAVFHNITAYSVANMVGQCFAVDPVATVTPEMEPWLTNIDGGGVSAIQQSKQALAHVLAFSRAGLWVDYPKTNGAVSKADAESGGMRPRIVLFDPRQVINWRSISVGANSKLSLVVISENYVKSDDGFESEVATQYRVLKLENGIYIIQLWKVGERNSIEFHEELIPLGGDGLPMTEIPFQFIGAEANGEAVEKPLVLDISNLNLAHYRNSADYEELVYMVGQPTPYLTGLTEDWVENVLKGSIMLGSRACIPLPLGASAGLLQASANTLPFEAMGQKEALMQAIGAKFVEAVSVAKTATESGIAQSNQTSILAAVCTNVSAAYSRALQWAAMFGGIQTANPEKDILWELNTDFAIARMQPQEQSAILSLYQADLITFEEARDKLKTGGVGYLSDEDAKDQLAQASEEAFAKAQRDMALNPPEPTFP